MTHRDLVLQATARIHQLKADLATAEADLDRLLGPIEQVRSAPVTPATRPSTPTKQSSGLKRPQVAALVREALEAAGDNGLVWAELEAQTGGRQRSVAARSALKQLVARGEAERLADGYWRLKKKKAPKA